jgi:hypothetical protein
VKLTQREKILLKYVLPKKKLRVKKRPKSIGEALGDSKPLHSPVSLRHQKFEEMKHLIQLEEKLDDSIEFAMLGPNVDRQGRNKWDRAGLKTPGSGKKAKARSRFKHKGTHMQVTTASGKRIVLPMPGLPHMAISAQIKAAKHNAKR